MGEQKGFDDPLSGLAFARQDEVCRKAHHRVRHLAAQDTVTSALAGTGRRNPLR